MTDYGPNTPHVDIVANFPRGEFVQELVERVAPDHPDASMDGTYLFATEPHHMDDCPFLSGDVLPMEALCGVCRAPHPCDEHHPDDPELEDQ